MERNYHRRSSKYLKVYLTCSCELLNPSHFRTERRIITGYKLKDAAAGRGKYFKPSWRETCLSVNSVLCAIRIIC
jgi:hypothetical protein